MKKTKTILKNFDASKVITSQKAAEIFLAEVLKAKDPEVVAYGIGEIARAKGMTAIARKLGISRQRLYDALNGISKAYQADAVIIAKALATGRRFNDVKMS